MADIISEVLREVDNLAEEMVEHCRALVRINTVNPYAGAGTTGLEKDGQSYVKPITEAMGGKTRLFEPPPDIYERMGVIGPKGRSWKDRPNLVSEFDLGPGKRIVINSHMDTVGVEGMRFDPFGAKLERGKIHGRGASDDKGGMVVGITAVKAILKFADALTGSIVHESVVDEECNGSGAGTLACCLEGYVGDEALVIDGQELMITRGCQGCLTANVGVQGKAGHAATGGVNAIDKGMIIKQAIDRFKEQREAEYPGCLLNLGVFHAGHHPAVVPGSAHLSLNMVYAIEEAAKSEQAGGGWGGADVREAFARVIKEADESDAWLREHSSRIEWVKDLVPFETSPDSPMVRDLCEAYERAVGEPAKVDVMVAWADGANTARYGKMPTVMLGPGFKEAAHSADEIVAVEDLVKGAKIVAAYLCKQLAKG